MTTLKSTKRNKCGRIFLKTTRQQGKNLCTSITVDCQILQGGEARKMEGTR